MADEGDSNRRVGWLSMAVGIGTGLLMGLWSFDGPMAVPDLLGEYGSVSRRLARLGHIAFLGLGILNVLLANELPRLTLADRWKRVASRTMNFGNLVLPPVLVLAAAWHPFKYLLPFPATAVFVAVVVTAWGVWGASRDADD